MHKAGYAAVWLLVLVIPLENAIVVPGIGTLGRMVGILALGIGILSILALNDRIRFHAIHWLMLVFVLLSGASFFWTIDPELTFRRIFTYFQLLLMMWLIFQWCDDGKKVQGLYLAFLVGSMGLAYGVIDQFRRAGMTVRIEAYNFNPNEIASILSLCVPFAWYLFLVRKGPVRWVYFLMLPVVTLSMLLTGSRGGMVKGLLGLLFVLSTPPRLGRIRGLLLLCVTVAAFAAVLQFLPDLTWNRLMTTQTEMTTGSLGGRGGIWSAGMQVFTHSPLLGVGAGAFSRTLNAFFTYEYAPHNVFVALMVEQGLVGLLVFLTIPLTAARSVGRLSGIELRLWITVLGIWGASVMSCNWEWRKQMWLLLILAVTHASHRLPAKGQPWRRSSNPFGSLSP